MHIRYTSHVHMVTVDYRHIGTFICYYDHVCMLLYLMVIWTYGHNCMGICMCDHVTYVCIHDMLI